MRFSRYACTSFMLSSVLLVGCANQNAVFRKRSITDGRPTVLTMDAKQRNVIMVPEVATGSNAAATGKWRVCAEAAPDVFSALSTSAGADLGFGQSGGQTEAKAKAAIAIAEAAGTIERTQTINLLRESMYRTCERFVSGAIDQPTFIVQAGRDWRAMIAVLAIEQLTRSARPPSTVLVAGGTATSISDPSGIVQKLVEAKAEQRDAEDAAANMVADAAKDCTKEEDSKKATCETVKAAAAAGKAVAEQRVVRAKEDVDDYRSALKLGAAGDVTTSSTVGGTSSTGGAGGAPSASDLATVAKTVENIAMKALDTDELQLFCIQKLASPGSTSSELSQRCLSLLSLAVGAQANALQMGLQAHEESLADEAARLSAYLVDDQGTASKWPGLIARSGLQASDQRLAAEVVAQPLTLSAVLDRFRRRLPDDYRQRVLAAMMGAGQ